MSGKRKSAAAKAELTVTVSRLEGGWGRCLPRYAERIELWCRAALDGRRGGSVAVALADDDMLRDLNHSYRGKDAPTNVLSFEGEGDEIGDIILSCSTLKREAAEQGKSFEQHTAHMVVHGCLHLLGYDHMNDADAGRMEKTEKAVLAGLGYPDPYLIPA